MGGWTAVIPLKPPGLRKTRLQSRLSAPARDALAEKLLAHLAAALSAVPAISHIMLLATAPPPGWRHGWAADTGLDLNGELARAQALAGGEPMLVIHPDLPFVTPPDIALMLGGPEITLAPDRHMAGTNALALQATPDFRFRFGPASFAHHRAAMGRQARIVERSGLALDIDTPEDLDLALAQGFKLD